MKNTKPLNALWQDLNRLQPSEKWSEKDRHAFRVGLKRLRVLLRLTEKMGYAELGEWDALFSKVFHVAGKRREMEIMQKLSVKYKVELRREVSKIPIAQKGLKEDWKLNYPVWRDWFTQEFHGWKSKKIEKFLRKWHAEFRRALPKMTSANVHDLRKKTKRLVYGVELCGLGGHFPLKEMKQFGDLAGDWHDLQLFAEVLEKSKNRTFKSTLEKVRADQKTIWKSLKSAGNQLS